MKLGAFITGTDTNVGKTVVSSLLIASLRSYGIKSGYFKPVQTGRDSDTETVGKLAGVSTEKFPTPVYSYPEAISPNRAAEHHGEEIQIDRVTQAWEKLEDRAWVVEGAGGILVPLNQRQTTRDLVHALNLPLLIVASTRLGTINHTLLTVESAKIGGLNIAGIVLVGPGDPGLSRLLKDLTQVPVLAQVPYYPFLSKETIQEHAADLFPAEVLKKIYD